MDWIRPVRIPCLPSSITKTKAQRKVGSIKGIILNEMMNGFPTMLNRDTMNAIGTATIIASPEAARLVTIVLSTHFQ